MPFFLLLLMANFAVSQTKNEWIIFSPLSKSFTIRLPELPAVETISTPLGLDNKKGGELSFFKCTKSINYYRLHSIFGSGHDRLLIREINVSECARKESDFEPEATAFLTYIAGNISTFHRDKLITINGMVGREILYHSGSYYTKDSKIYNRILVINAGNRIFIMTYYREEGTVGEEEDIFRSFQPKCEKNGLLLLTKSGEQSKPKYEK